MGLFSSLFRKKASPKVKESHAIAFVDYEHWYYSYTKQFGLKPNPVAWRKKIEEDYNLDDVIVFADFGHSGIDGELAKLRCMTNTIIETQQTFKYYKKDMTDFIMLDYIYQTAYLHPEIDTYIVFTGDGHFQSVVKYLIQKLKKNVVVYGVKDAFSNSLKTVASEYHELPTDNETLKGYYGIIVQNFDYVSKRDKIIPTFNGTVAAVARRNNVPEELICATLEDMLKKEFLYTKMQRVAFNRSVKVLAANWEALAKAGLWSYQN